MSEVSMDSRYNKSETTRDDHVMPYSSNFTYQREVGAQKTNPPSKSIAAPACLIVEFDPNLSGRAVSTEIHQRDQNSQESGEMQDQNHAFDSREQFCSHAIDKKDDQ